MTDYQPLRKCISDDDNELVIYGADSFSQFPRRDGSVHSKCDRALAAAGENDLVILRTTLDHYYHDWLRSCGLGTNHVIEYKALTSELSLSELIIADPTPILQIIKKLGRQPVYTPWFSGSWEEEAARALGGDHFGTSRTVTLKYNDKAEFKALCQELAIPVVTGDNFTFQPQDRNNFQTMSSMVRRFLSTHETVIIRGTLAESAMSLYKTNGADLDVLYREIVASGERQVLIEPFLEVTSTPNDQWAISRDGAINHLGMLDQICENGLVYIGNLKGQEPVQEVYDYIHNASRLIVTEMAESGYCGVVGIDYIVSDAGIYPVENNARFNGSSYVSMVVHNIEQVTARTVPFWKFVKTRTSPCSFHELIDRLGPYLHNGNKLNSVFPLNCKELEVTGDFNILLLGEDLNHIFDLEQILAEIGVKRDCVLASCLTEEPVKPLIRPSQTELNQLNKKLFDTNSTG